MFNELIEFFENSIPEDIYSFISVLGTLLILFFLDVRIFLASLFALILVVIVYYLSAKRSLYLNRRYNDALEQQVENLSSTKALADRYFKRLIKWNKKLSDLETVNFSLIWFGMIFLLVFSIYISAADSVEYGTIFALVMYVYEFIDSSLSLHLFFQQYIRLKEISDRLDSSN